MIQIRTNIFETNSSSVHALIMTDGATYKKLENRELLIGGYDTDFEEEFIPYEKAYEALQERFKKYPEMYVEYDITDLDACPRDVIEEIMSYEDIAYTLETYGGEEFEKFEDFYTTKSGEEVVAFGYFGRDG